CGDSETITVAALGHSWDDGEVIKEVSCTEDGEITYTCTRDDCNATKEETVSATGHNYVMTSTTATCTESGSVTNTCTRCGDSETITVAALGHSWDEGEVTTEATCTEAGVMTFKCTRDGCEGTKTEAIAATGHSYELISSSATCTSGGKISCKCSVCGDTLEDMEVEALGHSWDDGTVTTEATCTTAGQKTYTCTREGCEATKTETIAALGHDYEITSTTATCTTAGSVTYTCSRCNDTHTEQIADALGHDYQAEVTKEASCTEAGETTYTCSRCSDSYTEEIAALGHDWVKDDYESTVTCTSAGKIVYKCSRCEETKEEDSEALGHNYVGEIVTPVECEHNGYVTYTCTNCGYSYGSYIQQTGHTYDRTSGVTTAATCTTPEYTVYPCYRGDDTITEITKDALGHDFSGTPETTTDESGNTWNTYTCTRDGCDAHHIEEVIGEGEKAVTVSVWDGETVSESWLDTATTDEETGVTTYTIKSAEDLAGFAAYVNGDGAYDDHILDYTGATESSLSIGNYSSRSLPNCVIKLDTDIDLNNKLWTPIGTTDKGDVNAAHVFSGTFEGEGHTIYNLYVTEDSVPSSYGYGLFGYIWRATINNLTVENANVTGVGHVGALVGSTESLGEVNDIFSTITNCTVKGHIEVTGQLYVGGIVGSSHLTVIESCSVAGDSGSFIKGVYASISYDGSYVGGIAGYVTTSVTTTDRTNFLTHDQIHMYDISVSGLTISGTYYVGGLVGELLLANTSVTYVIGTKSSSETETSATGCSVSNCTIEITIVTDEYEETGDGVTEYLNSEEKNLYCGAAVGYISCKITISCAFTNVSLGYYPPKKSTTNYYYEGDPDNSNFGAGYYGTKSGTVTLTNCSGTIDIFDVTKVSSTDTD
ncbi:MAG: hypothetical protein LUE27_05910, partial [Clostridia bacterium]|nr:hypothetical protein [Clostridia bacterium]